MVDSKTNIMLVLVLLSFKNFTGSDYFKNFVLKKHNLQNYVADRTLFFTPAVSRQFKLGNSIQFWKPFLNPIFELAIC